MIKVYDNNIDSPTVGTEIDHCNLYQHSPVAREQILKDITDFAMHEGESTDDLDEMMDHCFDSEIDLIIETGANLVSRGLEQRRKRNGKQND